MKKLKVRYSGHKGKIAITCPFAVKTKAEIKEIVFFGKGEVKELPEIDAEKLCEFDSNFSLVLENDSEILKPKKKAGRPRLSKIEEPKPEMEAQPFQTVASMEL